MGNAKVLAALQARDAYVRYQALMDVYKEGCGLCEQRAVGSYDTLAHRPDELFTYMPPAPLHIQLLRSLRGAVGIQALPTARQKGGDIARYQTVASYTKAAEAGIVFMIIKASEHTTWTDPKFDEHWRGYFNAGLYVMPYHFFRSNYSGVTQARKVLAVAAPLIEATNGKTVIWLDVETADGVSVTTRRARIKEFVNTIHSEFRVGGCGIYCSPYLWSTLTSNMTLPDNVWGWVAHWTSASVPSIPVGWPESRVKVWQTGVYPRHPWTHAIPGITTEVDTDLYLGTLADLKDMLGITEEPPPLPELEQRVAYLESEVVRLDAVQAVIHNRINDVNATLAGMTNVINNQDARLTAVEGTTGGLINLTDTMYTKIEALEGRVTALEDGGGGDPTPVPDVVDYKVTETKAVARFVSAYNDAGRPIMAIYPSNSSDPVDRIIFPNGAVRKVYSAEIVADGGGRYYKLYDSYITGVDLYVRKDDGTLLYTP